MLVSLNWLRDYVEIDLSPTELGRRLTEAGLPVEGIEAKGDDFALNVEVTSNRPDCLGHLGIAREIAAITGKPLRLPDVSFAEAAPPAAGLTAVTVEAPDICPQYSARVLSAVRVGASPDWMVQRLETIGLRTVSNVVDVTNYVLMECGQPLHAFDLDKLRGKRIVVRRSRAGETITAINGNKIELNPAKLGMPADGLPLVIADAERPVAVAGVMGGLDTEVGPATKNLLLESADFEMLAIRKASRKLLLDSDSSYRFERGIDSAGVDWASRRAAHLLTKVAGATAHAGAVAVGGPPPAAPEVTLRIARIAAVLGVRVEPEEAERILRGLGFGIVWTTADAVRVQVPSHRRRDVSREIDLVEEVGRIKGYGSIPEDAPMPVAVSARSPRTVFEQRIAEALNAAGCWETLTKSLVDKTLIDLAADAPALTTDPDKTAFHNLRRSLLPGLLKVRQTNQNVGVEKASLYEISGVFLPRGGTELPDEPVRLGLLIDGETEEDWRKFQGALAAVFEACGLGEAMSLRASPAAEFDPGVSVQVLLGERPIGKAGRIAKAVRERFDLRRSVLAAEIDIAPLWEAGTTAGKFKGLPKFPAVVRDLNIVVGEDVLWRRIETAVRGEGIPELESLAYLSTYAKGLAEGRKSVTFSMTFRSPADTLTGEQATAFQQRVLQRLKTELGAELRA